MAKKDIFDIEDTTDGDPSLERLVAMASELYEQEKLAKELEDNLSTLKRQINHLKTDALPSLMAEVGLSQFRLKDGASVSVDDFVAGSLPKDPEPRAAALQWLEQNGAVDLIRTEVEMEFDKSEHNEALSLVAELEERGFDVSVKSGVHPQTLLAHVRERLRNGEAIPLEKLGIFAGRKVTIKPPKTLRAPMPGPRDRVE